MDSSLGRVSGSSTGGTGTPTTGSGNRNIESALGDFDIEAQMPLERPSILARFGGAVGNLPGAIGAYVAEVAETASNAWAASIRRSLTAEINDYKERIEAAKSNKSIKAAEVAKQTIEVLEEVDSFLKRDNHEYITPEHLEEVLTIISSQLESPHSNVREQTLQTCENLFAACPPESECIELAKNVLLAHWRKIQQRQHRDVYQEESVHIIRILFSTTGIILENTDECHFLETIVCKLGINNASLRKVANGAMDSVITYMLRNPKSWDCIIEWVNATLQKQVHAHHSDETRLILLGFLDRLLREDRFKLSPSQVRVCIELIGTQQKRDEKKLESWQLLYRKYSTQPGHLSEILSVFFTASTYRGTVFIALQEIILMEGITLSPAEEAQLLSATVEGVYNVSSDVNSNARKALKNTSSYFARVPNSWNRMMNAMQPLLAREHSHKVIEWKKEYDTRIGEWRSIDQLVEISQGYTDEVHDQLLGVVHRVLSDPRLVLSPEEIPACMRSINALPNTVRSSKRYDVWLLLYDRYPVSSSSLNDQIAFFEGALSDQSRLPESILKKLHSLYEENRSFLTPAQIQAILRIVAAYLNSEGYSTGEKALSFWKELCATCSGGIASVVNINTEFIAASVSALVPAIQSMLQETYDTIFKAVGVLLLTPNVTLTPAQLESLRAPLLEKYALHWDHSNEDSWDNRSLDKTYYAFMHQYVAHPTFIAGMLSSLGATSIPEKTFARLWEHFLYVLQNGSMPPIPKKVGFGYQDTPEPEVIESTPKVMHTVTPVQAQIILDLTITRIQEYHPLSDTIKTILGIFYSTPQFLTVLETLVASEVEDVPSLTLRRLDKLMESHLLGSEQLRRIMQMITSRLTGPQSKQLESISREGLDVWKQVIARCTLAPSAGPTSYETSDATLPRDPQPNPDQPDMSLLVELSAYWDPLLDSSNTHLHAVYCSAILLLFASKEIILDERLEEKYILIITTRRLHHTYNTKFRQLESDAEYAFSAMTAYCVRVSKPNRQFPDSAIDAFCAEFSSEKTAIPGNERRQSNVLGALAYILESAPLQLSEQQALRILDSLFKFGKDDSSYSINSIVEHMFTRHAGHAFLMDAILDRLLPLLNQSENPSSPNLLTQTFEILTKLLANHSHLIDDPRCQRIFAVVLQIQQNGNYLHNNYAHSIFQPLKAGITSDSASLKKFVQFLLQQYLNGNSTIKQNVLLILKSLLESKNDNWSDELSDAIFKDIFPAFKDDALRNNKHVSQTAFEIFCLLYNQSPNRLTQFDQQYGEPLTHSLIIPLMLRSNEITLIQAALQYLKAKGLENYYLVGFLDNFNAINLILSDDNKEWRDLAAQGYSGGRPNAFFVNVSDKLLETVDWRDFSGFVFLNFIFLSDDALQGKSPVLTFSEAVEYLLTHNQPKVVVKALEYLKSDGLENYCLVGYNDLLNGQGTTREAVRSCMANESHVRLVNITDLAELPENLLSHFSVIIDPGTNDSYKLSRLSIPYLAIGEGFQFLAQQHGASIQEVGNHNMSYGADYTTVRLQGPSFAHFLALTPDEQAAYMAGTWNHTEPLQLEDCPCRHDVGINTTTIGEGLRVVGQSADGVVEIVEATEGLKLGIQFNIADCYYWVDRDLNRQRLILEGFFELCRQYHTHLKQTVANGHAVGTEEFKTSMHAFYTQLHQTIAHNHTAATASDDTSAV